MSKFTIIHPYSRRGSLNIQRELAKAGLLGVKGLNPILSRGSFGSHAGGGGGSPYALIAGAHGTVRSGNGSSNTSGAVDTSGADLLIVVVAGADGNTPTITDSKSNTWTARTKYTNGQQYIKIYYVKNPTAGSGHTFTINPGGNVAAIIFAAFSGSDLTAPYDTENGASSTGTSSQASGSITPSVDNELVVTAIGTAAYIDGDFAVDSGFTIIDTNADFKSPTFDLTSGVGLAYLVQTTATAKNPTWNFTAGFGGCVTVASFKHS